MKTIVVGAGIIGALTAFRLAEAGADVTVIEAAGPASGASGASFGWVNASFHIDHDHYVLRAAGIEAHRRIADRLNSRATRWTGCLCWEEQGAAFDAQFSDLKSLGYDVRQVDRAEFQQLEPAVAAPERALLFAQEAVVNLPFLAADALTAAQALGARLVTGVRVAGLETRSQAIRGVRWAGGVIEADRVVLAAGTGTESLLAAVEVPLPMLDRPGGIMRSHPLPPLVSHVLASPGQELRQTPDGRIIAPTSAAHQSDKTEKITESPETLADQAAARVSCLLQREVIWSGVSFASRPVPQDGLPVMGACGPEGLYVATMHSGATLAPLAAELVAAEATERTLSNEQAKLIAPYRPERFKA
ncbi:MAG: FAD-dependent oxidoreductase [Pseudomonadota bacterium]